MKKIFIVLLLFFSSFSLISCRENINKQYFVEGDFVSEYNDATLKVSRITKEEYEKSNGVNVLKDVNNPVKNSYFRVELRIFELSDDVINLTNIKASTVNTRLTYYICDQIFNSFCNIHVRYDESRKDNMPYMIDINNKYYVFDYVSRS